MGETLSIPLIAEIKQVIKRVRPANWVVPMPPPKRFKPFQDDGAKAVKIDTQ